MVENHEQSELRQSVGNVVELQVNLDDVSGEVVGDAAERLLGAGALDVWTVAIGMKKGRPGVMVCVLCEAGREQEFAKLTIELTGSFGVRYRQWERVVLQRSHEMVSTRFGKVRIKVGRLDGDITVVSPEFADVKQVADAAGVSIRVAMDAAKAAGDVWAKNQGGA